MPTTLADSQPPARALPQIDKDNHAFWTRGKDGVLAICRCADCGYYVHPPVPFCPECESHAVAPKAVSGRGRVESFTVNHKQWVPGLPDAYVLALVELEEQEGLRVVTNITHCAADEVRFGMAVEVWFEPAEDLWIPLFRPVIGA
jgi:uncharacterized OB-fold protein